MTSPSLPAWHVTSVTQRTEFVPAIGPVEGYRVNYETTSGVQSFVFVPTSGISDKVAIAAKIQTDVEHLHAIHTLASS